MKKSDKIFKELSNLYETHKVIKSYDFKDTEDPGSESNSSESGIRYPQSGIEWVFSFFFSCFFFILQKSKIKNQKYQSALG